MNRNYTYTIQVFVTEENKWMRINERLSGMGKQFALGAWTTFLTFSGKEQKSRLVCNQDGSVHGRLNYKEEECLDKLN